MAEKSPKVPKVAAEAIPVKVMTVKAIEARRAGQRGQELAVGLHARATGFALTCTLLGEISLQNKLGTDRPQYVLPTVDPTDPSMIYFIPTNTPIEPDTLKVTYYQSSFHISLYRLFKSHGLMPITGSRDIYKVKMSEKPVIAGGLEGYALTLDVGSRVLETIQSSDVTKLKRHAKEMERKARQALIKQGVQAKVDAAAKVIKGEESASD